MFFQNKLPVSWLVVGLGNPGDKYESRRASSLRLGQIRPTHNGFAAGYCQSLDTEISW